MMCGTSFVSRRRMTWRPRLTSHSLGLPISKPSIATPSSGETIQPGTSLGRPLRGPILLPLLNLGFR
jgi:hypothetical protein